MIGPNDLDEYAAQIEERAQIDADLVAKLLREAAARWREAETKLEVYRAVEAEARLMEPPIE